QGWEGGLFELSRSDTPGNRTWVSLNGTIRPTEIHNIAFDPLSHVLISGNQDTGTSYQLAAGSLTWTDIAEGDGAFVAVDADQTRHPGTSLRYESFIKLQSFRRHTFNNHNIETTVADVALNIVSGNGSGQTLLTFDATRQFNNPWVLNTLDSRRMLIGTASIYESLDMGDSLANVGTAGAAIASLSYGSRLNGVDFPDAFYVGAGTNIY